MNTCIYVYIYIYTHTYPSLSLSLPVCVYRHEPLVVRMSHSTRLSGKSKCGFLVLRSANPRITEDFGPPPIAPNLPPQLATGNSLEDLPLVVSHKLQGEPATCSGSASLMPIHITTPLWGDRRALQMFGSSRSTTMGYTLQFNHQLFSSLSPNPQFPNANVTISW